MTTKKICQLCGWEITKDFDLWVDMYDNTACGRNGQLTHRPA